MLHSPGGTRVWTSCETVVPGVFQEPETSLDCGLYQTLIPDLMTSPSSTALSQEFLQSAVFEKDIARLQAWASQKVRRMNAHFSWHIGADQELFAECLWNIWSQFSEKYHSLPGIDVGFVISGESEMQTAAATLFACALCGQELLDGLTIVSCWKDRRLWITPDGKLLKSKPA